MRRDQGIERWHLILLALTVVALLLLLHSYRGLIHDSHLYTLQALNWIHPELYGNDVFLRFGSQDNYTLFSPMYGAAISALGLESAAAVITACSILLFIAASLTLAAELLPLRQALVAIILLLLIPSHYGPAQIFHYLEEFVTPRQLAEALVLFCIAAWLKGHRLLASLLAIGAMLIHPIIGLAGALVPPAMEWVIPKWRKLWPLAVLAGLISAAALIGWLSISRWQFDDEWHRIVMNRTYLGLRNWSSEDWARVAAVAATLGAAGFLLEGQLQRLSKATLISVSLLLLLAFVGGDLLRVAIVVQAQTWRALWLATVLAILFLPPIFASGWQQSQSARTALPLLAAAWITPHGALAMVAAPLALIVLFFKNDEIAGRSSRLLFTGSWLVLAVAMIHGLAVAQLTWNEGLTAQPNLPPLLDRLLLLNHGSVLMAALLTVSGYLAMRHPSSPVIAGLFLIAIAALGATIVPGARTWTSEVLGDELHTSFRSWRAHIPPGSDVLWTGEALDRNDGAFLTWVLLERPSFISRNQAPNALFSREAAIEMDVRAKSLDGLLPFWNPFGENQTPLKRPLLLQPVCEHTKVRYLVTKEQFADAAGLPAPDAADRNLLNYKLYICS